MAESEAGRWPDRTEASSDVQSENLELNQRLAAEQSELNTMNQRLVAAQLELDQANERCVDTQTELNTTNQKLFDAQDEPREGIRDWRRANAPYCEGRIAASTLIYAF
jgi:predicted  nucleic acid-binding Zn-ribbon protein